MVKVPLPVLGVWKIEESERAFRFRSGPISDFYPFAILAIARAFKDVGVRTKPLLTLKVQSCVGGWKSPVFVDVPFGVVPHAPEAVPPASPIIVQGHDPCEFWLEVETEEYATTIREMIEKGGAKMVLYLVPLKAVWA